MYKFVSEKVKQVQFSGIRKVFEAAQEMEKEGHRVIHLEIGRPDFDTPKHIKESAKDALDRGMVHYVSNYGILELREALTRKIRDFNKFEAKPNEILITVGASEAIFCSLVATLNPGDEILIPEPGWINYTYGPALVGAVSKPYIIDVYKRQVHVCVNGLGERSGNASMEDVAVALKACLGFEMEGFRFDMLKETSELVRNLTNTDIAQNKPVVGDRVYTRESGIGIDMLFKNPLAMFSVNPEFVGLEPKVVYGKKSGKLSIQFMMEKMGVTATDEQISEALVQVKDLGAKKKGTVSEEEVKEIISKTIG